MHKTMVKVRLAARPTEEIEVTAREAVSLRAQGLLLLKTAAKTAPAAPKGDTK